MSRRTRAFDQWGFLLCLVVLGLIATALIVPFDDRAKAAGDKNGLATKTVSHDDSLPNYDIRSSKEPSDYLLSVRTNAGKTASAIADARETMVRGENALKSRLPQVKFEYNTDIRIPEVITPDVWSSKIEFLSPPSTAKRSELLRNFVKENSDLVGVNGQQSDMLKVTADYTNPDGNLSFAHLEQTINDIPVFRGEVKAGFTKDGRIIRVINNLAPGLDYDSLSTDFGDPLAAVRSAAQHINIDSNKLNLTTKSIDGTRVTFGTGDFATTAEKMYFPTEPGVAVAAWRVLIWQPVNAFYVIVDAQNGTMLWRKNITEDQTDPSTYSVYTNPNAMINVADNPFPMTPGPLAPNGAQGAAISRTSITRIGNEAPYAFNNNGWITNGGDRTDGNALQAGLDRDGTDGVDPNTEAINAGRNFTFAYSPLNPNTNTGDAPLTPVFQQGSTTQLFYIANWYHDELYRLGFTEQARNFQASNYGRGGSENDRISGEGQDSSGTNNANFSTPADGGRGRMQMYIWTAPNPDIDGNLDAEVVIHEITHGTSNRLHGNGSGLSTSMSRGMGEGWGDFYGNCLLSEPTDPLNGIYTTGGYDTYLGGPGVNNYYYAIRRFPKGVITFTGGTNNRPHNPLTFADIDGSQINLNDGAFAPRFVGTADQVHNAGEVWGIALWEVRAKLVTRLGWAAGNRKTLQFVTDGMKLAPFGPTFLQERDAIIAAASASSLAPDAAVDVADVWAGFATRGMGFSAVVNASGSGAGDARVTEAFDLPNLIQTPTFTVSDAPGDNDGFPEPGEALNLTIPLSNNTGNTATATTLQLVGGNSATYGTIAHGATASQTIAYTVPANTPCGSAITLTFNVNSSLGATSFTRVLIIGVPVTTFTENFDSVTAPNLPAGWLTAQSGIGVSFVSTPTGPDTAPNSLFTPDTSAVGGASLTSPSIPITATAAVVSFRHNFSTEAGWDGGALEISINGGAYTDILTAGGRFIDNGYNGVLGVAAGNPVSGRPAWSGDSSGYITTTAQLPASAAGQNVNLRWLFGSDTNTFQIGWNVDTVKVFGTYTCQFSPTTIRSPFDLDGDSKTDLAIFRPAVGEWWWNRSSNGSTGAVQFGNSNDKIAVADYTGDRKADVAFWRPSTGQWFVLRSEDQSFFAFPFGTNGDVPVPADYDGDGKADAAVFRPSTLTWFISKSSGGTDIVGFGATGDQPVAADYDGDGKADIATFRPNAPNGAEWWIRRSSNASVFAAQFGAATDKTVAGDYTGDGKADVAYWRPSNGNWFVLRSENNSFYAFPFGTTGDVPSPGDYDGDGKIDAAVFRPSNSNWFVQRTTAGLLIQQFGTTGDLPLPNAFVR